MEGLFLRGSEECVVATVSGFDPMFERNTNCEVNHDDYISRWRNTNFSREDVLKQIL